MSNSLPKIITVALLGTILLVSGCVTAPEKKSQAQPSNARPSAITRQISVPSDPKAQYYVLDKGGSRSLRAITTKRIGPSGTSYSKRLYNCAQNTVKYLGTGDSLSEMNNSSPSPSMGSIVNGSIAYYIGLEACR